MYCVSGLFEVLKVEPKNTKTDTLQTLQLQTKEKMLKSLEATIFNISESCKSCKQKS
jgi:3-deoxy-D-manno-octulosonic acid (KDO) 8-phosphate synthase